MKSIWIERKNRMSKRLKGWRRIRKGENLRPGQAVTNKYGTLAAQFLEWNPDYPNVAALIPLSYIAKNGSPRIRINPYPPRGRPRDGERTSIYAMVRSNLRVLA
jgi:hypothetical protein